MNKSKKDKNMKWIKLTRCIIESILFVSCGFLVKLSFSGQLNYITNILLFICAIATIIYITINNIKN